MNPGAGPGQPKPAAKQAQKAALRAKLSLTRANRDSSPELEMARTVRALAACSGAEVVAAYLARTEEPQTAELIEALWLSGVRVLLPVLTTAPDWAWYEGPQQLSLGALGIQQPTGARLGAQALSTADWIWLPGLAGTSQGQRLGTGGGWYDRALAWSRPGTGRGLLLFDDEVLERVPTDPWDEPVDLLITEQRRIDCRRGIAEPVSEL